MEASFIFIISAIIINVCSALFSTYYDSGYSSGSNSNLWYIIVPIVFVFFIVVATLIFCRVRFVNRRRMGILPSSRQMIIATQGNQYAPSYYNQAPYYNQNPSYSQAPPYAQPPAYEPPPPYSAPSAPIEPTKFMRTNFWSYCSIVKKVVLFLLLANILYVLNKYYFFLVSLHLDRYYDAFFNFARC